ncbi:MAG: DUF3048 domain-containing protein, partial [Chloroflexota bacterium]
MKKYSAMLLLVLLISACSKGVPEPTEAITSEPLAATVTPTKLKPTPTPLPPTDTPTPTITPSATPPYPEEGYGPDNFPNDVNPLTGLIAEDFQSLDKRPVAVKINIVPRNGTRPPWGLTDADIVFDYYQNNGYTRFHTIFYGEEAELAGPIRS